MKVTILGTGYVGLTTAIALAYLQHDVTCIDIDEKKISLLKDKRTPIYEPHLESLMELVWNHLTFTTDLKQSISQSEVVFIAVGTPSNNDGTPNLSYLKSAAESIGQNLGNNFTVVINKSTVPIGSGNWVESIIKEAYQNTHQKKSANTFSIASNPEFLREGSALHDTFYPDRIVVGSESNKAIEILYKLYKPILEQTFTAPNFLPRPENLGAVPFITTNLASAELIKYAANAFLALKISYINEIAQLSEKVGADIVEVAKGIGLDARIGTRFLQAGIGWGGSCFGKDTSALISTASEYGLNMPIVSSAKEVNRLQKSRIVEKLLAELKILKGKSIALLGLAFKPHTDDLRDAPSIVIANMLIERGAKIKAHDPIVSSKAAPYFPSQSITFHNNVQEIMEGADVVLLITEWPEYRDLSWEKIGNSLQNPIIVDGRNFLDRERLTKAGFKYLGIGR